MADKKMKMVKDKDGKMVPEFAADGKGKMSAGKMVKKKGMAKGMAAGKQVKKKGMAAGKMVKKMMAGGKTKKGYSRGKLVGDQAKLDKNKDGKISGDDFKMLRGGKAAGKMVKKKGYAAGKMVKKGMANGGKAKSMAKGKAKVRGAGIAKKGVRPAKMR